MNTHFSHPWSSGLEIFVALVLGFWLGNRHTRLLPGVVELLQSLLGT